MVDENDVFDMIPELIEEPADNENVVDNNEIEEVVDTGTSEETTEVNTDTPIEESPDKELAQSFYALLQERELVEEKEINSWEEVEEEIDKYKTRLPDQVRESLIKSTSPVAQELLDFAINKPNLTQEDLNTYFQALQEDNSIGGIETNEQAREALRPSLVNQWGESTADIMLDSLEDENALIDKAKETTASKSQQLNEQARQERQQMEQQNQQFVDSIFQTFDDQPWQKTHTTKVKQFYTNGEADKVIQEITQDPQSLVQLVNILSYYDSKKKEFNLDTFFNKANTKEATSIRENIKRGLQNRGTSTKQTRDTSGFDPTNYELA